MRFLGLREAGEEIEEAEEEEEEEDEDEEEEEEEEEEARAGSKYVSGVILNLILAA